MKKLLLSAVALSSMLALFGCNNRTEEQVLNPAVADELQPMQQSYKSVLPCADCEGIETLLFLEKDGTWVMNQRYLGAKTPAVFASYGTWARTADKLVLTASNGEKLYFRPKAQGLEMLDREGNTIVSRVNNYTLEPTHDALPATPMAMKGMYRYETDKALFQDCATGRTFSVVSNAELERGYAAARGKDSRPVLLKIEAHFTVQASPDNGKLSKALVADKSVTFDAHKDCND